MDVLTRCEKCNYILQNLKLFEETQFLDEVIDKHQFKEDQPNQQCHFCFGLLCDENNFKFILSQIQQGFKEFEFINFKLTTCFSPLFLIYHHYWKICLKTNYSKDLKELTYIDSSLLRKLFKPLIIPKIIDEINKPQYNKSDFEIKVTVEFKQEVFTKVRLYSN